MLLEKNGRESSSKRTRHINIRYFFVTDRISAGELNLSYCPTLNMIGDYFTKPLQGSLFWKSQNTILGITDTDIPRYIKLAKLACTAWHTLKSKQTLKLGFGTAFHLMETTWVCWELTHLESQSYIDLINIIHVPRRASQSCTSYVHLSVSLAQFTHSCTHTCIFQVLWHTLLIHAPRRASQPCTSCVHLSDVCF